jgi:hypothetical protein
LDSYDVALDAVKKSNSTLSEHEARVKVAELFRPRFHSMEESAKIENSGAKEYENGEFAFNEQGRMYYPKDGVTAEELHLNQLRLSELHDKPEEYSLEAHQTTILIEQAFRNGSTVVVTSYGRNNGDNRDVLEYHYDSITNKGFVRVHNTEVDGKFHAFDDIKEIAKSKFLGLHEMKITSNVFVLSDKPLEENKVRQTFTHLEQHVGHTMKETIMISGKNTLQEVKQTAISIEGYIRRKQDVRLKEIPIMDGDTLIHRVRRMFEHKGDKKDGEDKKDKLSIFQHYPDHDKGVEKVRVKKHDINLLGSSLETVKQIRQQVREKIVTSVATLLFVRATGIGIGGAFASLESLIHVPQVSLESTKRTGKEKIKRQGRKEESLKRKQMLERMQAFRMSEGFKKLTKKERCTLRRKEKVLRIKERILLQRKERRNLRRKETVLCSKEKKLLQHKEQINVRRKEKQLWKMLKRLAQKRVFGSKEGVERRSLSAKIKRKEKIEKIRVTKKEKQVTPKLAEHHAKRQERQHVIEFSLGFVLWLLLEKHYHVLEHDNKINKRILRREGLKGKTPAPWLIFAIIWHLAMIREQGKRTVTRQKKAKKQQTHYYPISMPPAGVIFAFHP